MTKILALLAIIGAVCYVLIVIRSRVRRAARTLGVELPSRRPNPDTRQAAGEPGGAGTPSDLARRARDLRLSGRKTEAVRLVRTETGMEWDDAERFVRTLR